MNFPYKSKIFSHRGASRRAAENTHTAFDLALEYDIDGIETDVQLTRDRVPVLWHDRFLGKIGYPEKRIDDCAYSELQNTNFAAHFSPASTFEPIMSLEDFVLSYRHRCQLLLEIKNWEGEDELRQQTKVNLTLQLAGKTSSNSVIVSSFHLPSLVYANKTEPDSFLVYNCGKSKTLHEIDLLLNTSPFLYGFCLHKDLLAPSMVELLRNHGKTIAVYTCNTDTEIRNALALEVDVLITDAPEKALAIRMSYRQT